nr:immune inhibitor A [Bacteroidota bacterium]
MTTPFINFAGKPNSKLDFWINYNCESGYDGAYIQYSLDNVNWNVLGTYLDVNGTNWYNVPSLFGSTISSTGWSGTSGGWQHITYKLGFYNFNGPVKFRFAFEADNIIEYDGFSIDNFNVYQTPSTDVELTEIASPQL